MMAARNAYKWRAVAWLALIAALVIVAVPPPAHAVLDWFYKGAAQRNKEDRERILNILAYQRVIGYDDRGKILVIGRRKLRDYYIALSTTGKLKHIPQFHDDEEGKGAGQFWQNFFDRKDHTRGDLPAVMDPFENDDRGLATAMHSQLQSGGSGAGGDDYALTAAELKLRGIDILDKEMRRGVSAGAGAMIKALGLMTGGTSDEAVAWMEDAAKAAKDIKDDPAGAFKSHIKGKIDEELNSLFEDKLKSVMGEDNYNALMEKYASYGDKQQRFKALMEDLYRTTGNSRFRTAAKLLEQASPDAIAERLTKMAMKHPAKATAGNNGAEGKGKDKPKPPEEKSAAKDGKKAAAKTWDDMSDAEKREALKANDPAAWKAFGELMRSDPSRALQILNAKDLADRAKAQREKMMASLRGLNHTKMLATLKTLRVTPPDDFFNCLCRAAGYGSSSASQYYHPGTIGEYNKRYSCNQPGEPCVVSGFGCSRHPLPGGAEIWQGCMERHRLNTVKTADGKIDPNSGETLDISVEKALRARKKMKP